MKFTKRAMVHSKEIRESQKEFWDECGVSLHLLKGQFDSLIMSAEHNSCLRPTCTTSL